MEVKLNNEWKSFLQDELDKEYFQQLLNFLDDEYEQGVVFPPQEQIFNAFNCSLLDNTKVVILGQDPYHGAGQAHGLSFSVPAGVKCPPSLRNIFKELNQDLGKEMPTSFDLTSWANQGVLLLNATLTVREGCAGSHQKKGWEQFTDEVIKKVSKEKDGLVFILWGNYAIKKQQLIDESKHLVLTSVHPSPLSASRGFFGNKHFSKANAYLINKGRQAIEW